MALEAATYVDDLVVTNPVGSDQKSQGDDHLRLLKTILKATFPNADHAIYLDQAVANVASAATCAIGAATTNFVNITGTTTITGFGTIASGIWRFGVFAGALTLTHNATSLILPGGANITTAAGDTFLAVSLGSGNWRVLFYIKASGKAVIANAFSEITSPPTTLAGYGITDALETLGEVAGLNTQTDSYTLVLTDKGKTVEMNKATATTLTVPPNSSVAFPTESWVEIVQLGAGAVTITPGSGVTLRAPQGLVLDRQYSRARLRKRGTNEWVVELIRSALTGFLHVRDEKAAGTDGGTFTSGAWRTRTLNTTVTNEISGASVSSDQITLPAGTYMIEARAPAFGNNIGFHKAKLANITDTSDVIIGSVTSCTAANQTDSFVIGRFTIAGTKVFELQHRSQGTQSTNGFGQAAGFSVVEVYSEVLIWKVA